MTDNSTQHTTRAYGDFQAAFDYLNQTLFDNSLPQAIVTFPRSRHAAGYIVTDGFKAQSDQQAICEIGLNPETFSSRTAETILSSLAHEMVHLQQHACKTLPSTGYHNKDFAHRMRLIGLQASATGQPGGADTGPNMTHYVIAGGRFEQVAKDLIAQGWTIEYAAARLSDAEKARKKKKSASKTKYTCAVCGQNAWARPDAQLICGADGARMTSGEEAHDDDDANN